MPQDCMILHAAKAKDLDIDFTSPFERRRLGVHTLQRHQIMGVYIQVLNTSLREVGQLSLATDE